MPWYQTKRALPSGDQTGVSKIAPGWSRGTSSSGGPPDDGTAKISELLVGSSGRRWNSAKTTAARSGAQAAAVTVAFWATGTSSRA
jgi:hypothetical protein